MKSICVVMEKHGAVHLGGAELQADLLARELASRPGVRVFYLSRDVPTPDVAAALPYEVRKIGQGRGALRKRAVFFDAPRLLQALREIRPSAIYQRMKLSYTGICARYASAAGVPLFFHAAIDSDLSTRRRQGRPIANLPFELVENTVACYGIRRASHVIVQTRRQAMLARNFGRDDATLVPNFQPLPGALPERRPEGLCVLWVANFHAHKRPLLFLELARRMAHRDDIRFVMIGKPNDKWSEGGGMAAIEAARNVTYLGQQPIEEVNRWMERADVFVNTSSLEGFPNTFIQAWSRGAIVVSLDVDVDGGLDELGIGYLCASLDRMVDVIDALSRSEASRNVIRQRAFAYVQEHHSMSNARRLADLILSAGPGGGA